jgi:hypothetical protein
LLHFVRNKHHSKSHLCDCAKRRKLKLRKRHETIQVNHNTHAAVVKYAKTDIKTSSYLACLGLKNAEHIISANPFKRFADFDNFGKLQRIDAWRYGIFVDDVDVNLKNKSDDAIASQHSNTSGAAAAETCSRARL